jgi:hypothetical protein
MMSILQKNQLLSRRPPVYKCGDHLTVENIADLFQAGLDNMKVSMYDGPEQIPVFNEINYYGIGGH